jgi:hypothetical protein
MTWPINSGKDFKGVYDLHNKSLVLFTPNTKASDEDVVQIKDLNEPPPHVIDKTLLFILLGIALILILTGLILCVFSIMNKRKELAQQDFSENFRNKHMVEHYEYMNNIRDVIKSNQPYS